MEKKIIGNYELIACTAIAASAGDTERQDAILVRDLDVEFDPDAVLFGYNFKEMDADALEDAFMNDSSAFSTYEEDITSVLIDGRPLSAFYYKGEI